MSTVTTAPAPAEAEPATKSGKKKLLVGLLVLALGAAAAWWFLLRPAGAQEAPKPGEVVKLDAIQVNLEGNHYLRIGIALQATKGSTEVEGSKALDATIELFTGEDMTALTRKPYREQLKRKLEQRLEEAYDGEVMGVYFTDFVTQ